MKNRFKFLRNPAAVFIVLGFLAMSGAIPFVLVNLDKWLRELFQLLR